MKCAKPGCHLLASLVRSKSHYGVYAIERRECALNHNTRVLKASGQIVWIEDASEIEEMKLAYPEVKEK